MAPHFVRGACCPTWIISIYAMIQIRFTLSKRLCRLQRLLPFYFSEFANTFALLQNKMAPHFVRGACCPTWIRTKTLRTKIGCTTLILSGNEFIFYCCLPVTVKSLPVVAVYWQEPVAKEQLKYSHPAKNCFAYLMHWK